MRVLIETPAARHLSVAAGWCSALRACGHEPTLWNPIDRPAFDAFDEANPDLYVRTSAGLRPAAEGRCIGERGRRVRVVDRVDIRPGFDSLKFRPGVRRPYFECDACFVGSYRPEKQRLIDAYLAPLLDAGLRLKFFGPVPMPYHQYLGPLDDADLPDLYATAKVALNISAGRVSERAFQVVGVGGLLVSNVGFEPATPLTPDEFLRRVRLSAGFFEYQGSVANDLMDVFARSQTYFHRVADIFREAGLAREAGRALERGNAQ